MNKILLGQEDSIRLATCHVIDNPSLNKDCFSFVVFFDSVISLVGKENKLSNDIINIEEYPFESLLKIKVTQAPIQDPFEAKLRTILYCKENDITYFERASKNEREELISSVGEKIDGSVPFLKSSFLTVDIISFMLLDSLPSIDKPLSEDLKNIIVEYKKSEHQKNLVKGIKSQVSKYSGSYYLSSEIESDIKSYMISTQSIILDILDFDKITTFDFKSMISDGASSLSSLIVPFLPIGTIQEIYSYIKKIKKISNSDDILFMLSLIYLQKLISNNLTHNSNTKCDVCKLTYIEVDQINDNEDHSILFKTMENMCEDHRLKYLTLRKFHQLMGKPLLKAMIKT